MCAKNFWRKIIKIFKGHGNLQIYLNPNFILQKVKETVFGVELICNETKGFWVVSIGLLDMYNVRLIRHSW